MKWVENISDPKLKSNFMAFAVGQWNRSDPGATQRYPEDAAELGCIATSSTKIPRPRRCGDATSLSNGYDIFLDARSGTSL